MQLLGNKSSFVARPFLYHRVAVPEQKSYRDIYCVQVNAHWSVCKHISPDLDFALLKDQRIIGTWPTEIGVPGGSRFEVVTTDLDGDHKDDLIVADCVGINTGVEIFWRLSIFPNYQERPLQFITEQYAAQGTFLQTPGDPLCNLLITEWQYGVYEPHSKDFKAWDYIGRWYHYKAGLLEPVVGRPFRVRRWSDAWYRVPLHRQTPYDWLTHPTAKTFPSEPLTRAEIVAEVRGEIIQVAKIETESGNQRLDISLHLPTGETRAYHLYGDDLTDQLDQFCHLGDARTGILLPKDYEPADLQAWLVGKQVRMVDYQSRYQAVRRILWV